MKSLERTLRGAVSKGPTMRPAMRLLLPLLCTAAQAYAGEPGRNPPAVTTTIVQPALAFPRIHGAGGVLAVDASAAMPSTSAVHRVLVDISDDATTPEGVNRRLDDASRALNLYAMAGVPNDKVHIAILLQGKGTPLALSDAAYAKKFGHANPDARLILQLRAAGVEFFVCGQALSRQGFTATDVRPEVRLALSALTKREELQAAGYGAIP